MVSVLIEEVRDIMLPIIFRFLSTHPAFLDDEKCVATSTLSYDVFAELVIGLKKSLCNQFNL